MSPRRSSFANEKALLGHEPDTDERSVFDEETCNVGAQGGFIANADGSLVLATSETISSEFNNRDGAGWLITSYTLAMCATQSVANSVISWDEKPNFMPYGFFFVVDCAVWSVSRVPKYLFFDECRGAFDAISTCKLCWRTSHWHIIRKYELFSVLGAISASLSYTLMLAWWHGHTSFPESLYIVPSGFGKGIALGVTFIPLAAGVDSCQMAIASSGLYLSSNIGMVGGLSIAAAVLQVTLRK
ncbi:hypothetical protein BKA65DRAFT_554502 [Rhexocercosporidium sp. MPI-PUGE-AT-0058]|nr:hypothetical protein BKA65DRAFT_554502 [Rhexocercosporidium sp. MPI-PUGE-AT-0058]